MIERNITPYYQLFEQLKHQFCQWIFVERHSLIIVSEKFNKLFEEMSKVTGFRMKADVRSPRHYPLVLVTDHMFINRYENWVTRKRRWDKEWQVGIKEGPLADTGPSTEVLQELNDLPLWYVGEQKVRDIGSDQVLFDPP